MTVQTPSRSLEWEKLCGVCHHRYGDHYRTFDGDNEGCTMFQNDRQYACACQGFTDE